MTKFAFIVALIFLVFSLEAQTPKKLKELKVGKIENVSVDRLGNLFLIFKNGSIKKYDPNGKVLADLKGGNPPALLEPWFHPVIFAYYREGQKCVSYDHNFESPQTDKVDPAVAINPFLVCPTNDKKLLLLDKADWSIKKFDPANNKVLTEFNVDTANFQPRPSFSYIREYQNLIFLLDRNSGILIFSNLGKKVNHIKCSINNFGFYGVELFYLMDDKVIFFDLYSEKTREVKVEPGKFAIVTDERIFVIKGNDRVTFYEFLTQPEDEKPEKEK